MILKSIFYKDGCIGRVGSFDISSVKLSSIKYHEDYKVMGQIMLKNSNNRKLFFSVSVDCPYYHLKKKVSRKFVLNLINLLNNPYHLKLVRINYLPEDFKFYRTIAEQEVYL